MKFIQEAKIEFPPWGGLGGCFWVCTINTTPPNPYCSTDLVIKILDYVPMGAYYIWVRIIQALKALINIAKGETLGNDFTRILALKGRNIIPKNFK